MAGFLAIVKRSILVKKRNRAIILSTLLIIAAFAGAFLIYVADYYRADDFAIQTMKDSAIKAEGNLLVLSPTVPLPKGIIFYPGAKVEETAYLPLLEKLSQQGITCVLVKMPFHLAFFNANAADSIYQKLPEIHQWYIAGHSLGGAMASSYAGTHQDTIDGVVLLGAYIYGDFPVEKAITIYGSKDTVLTTSKIVYTENVFVIEGGNHAQFGNYGKQKGDGNATITANEQQDQAVEIILNFINQ